MRDSLENDATRQCVGLGKKFNSITITTIINICFTVCNRLVGNSNNPNEIMIHNIADLFTNDATDVMNVQSLYKYSVCKFVHDCDLNVAFHNVKFDRASHKYPTRNKYLLSMPRIHTKFGSIAISSAGPTILNRLPRETHVIMNAFSFGRALKAFLIQIQYPPQIEAFRFVDINPVPKQSVWLGDILPAYNQDCFKEVTRLTYSQFNKVYFLIKDNGVFRTAHKGQTPVSIQLAIVLHRFETYGNGASVSSIVKLFGISDGSSITRKTRRVIQAIVDVEHWPSEKEKAKAIVPETANYLMQCVGWVDGAKIKLDEAPHMDREAYFDGKKNYSLNVS
ncbi:hypothetical protein Bhyg_12360 [Pseudolycoriella hygida]|uniref:Uncharacterized protein n=1 Tax=Pseudolycoriella hygida TaxID=35572 RepID=A0A9Q0S147_9DIPT|nr:hypothetical protein Bhyg_12360 [Pseudolycoriella hygida]